MADVGAWIKQHKTALAVGTAGVVGLWLIFRNSSSAGSGNPALQIAQTQEQQNLQMAQIQAQQNEATIGAQTQVDQTNAQLQGEQNQLAVEAALGLAQNGSQTSLEEQQLADAESQQQAYDSLLGPGIAQANAIIGQGGKVNAETGINEIALLLQEEGASGINSLNTGTTEESLASQLENLKLLQGLEGIGGSALGGLL
jgi:hypothetical protein